MTPTHATTTRRAWTVTLAGLGINLALGVLYSWSIIAKALVAEWGWSTGTASVPYAVAVGTFAITMVFAGRAQDRFGPRIVATAGGALAGAGLIISGLAGPDALSLVVLGFGIVTGMGIGLGYAATTPAAIKWFAAERKGLITGLVVSGFGLASVYIAPLTAALLRGMGIGGTFTTLGIVFVVLTVALAQLIANPPADYVPAPAKARTSATGSPTGAMTSAATLAGTAPVPRQYTWQEMVRTPQFVLLWLMYACSAFAGLMIIGHMAKIAAAQLSGAELGFLLVAVLAVGNAGGRIVAGIISDRIGGLRTMLIVFVAQGVLMLVMPRIGAPIALALVAACVGFCYGANLSVFPSTTASFFGTRNLGANYGLVFTAWGVGGVFGSMTAGRIVDATGSYTGAFVIAAVLCAMAALLSLAAKAPETEAARKSTRPAQGHADAESA